MTGYGRRALRLVAGLFVLAVTLAIAVLTALQRATGETWWWVELSRYMPFYWLLLPSLASLAASFWLGRPWVVASLATIAVLVGVTMRPVWGQDRSDGEHVRVMTFNIKAGRAAEVRDGVLALGVEVARHNPDILAMQDANGLLIDRGAPALVGAQVFGMPHVFALGQYVVASRWPIIGCEPGQIGYRDESHRYLRCTIDVKGTRVTLATAHFLSPRNGLYATRVGGVDGADEWRQNYQDRMAQSRSLARDIGSMPRPLIVVGDLNAPESSPVVRTLLEAGVRDAFSAAGRGYGYTYGQAMRGIAFLRIDHILVSPDIAVVDSFVGHGEASEHRPVIADLVLPR